MDSEPTIPPDPDGPDPDGLDPDILETDCQSHCPTYVRETLDLIGNKWSVPIILTLHGSPVRLRYADLQRRIGGITPKELAKQLRLLESNGLIGRQIHPAVPPKVEYWLTDLGNTLFPSIKALAEWALHNGPVLAEKRREHAGRQDIAAAAE